LQKAAFRNAESGLLRCCLMPFAVPFAAFRKAAYQPYWAHQAY
jgi:hypothetical protein